MASDELSNVDSQFVERTGLALVHEGELIIAAPDATAMLTAAPVQVVNYYFPVEIEVVGAGGAEALAEQIYDALQRELNALS
jgi:hypothetical protein